MSTVNTREVPYTIDTLITADVIRANCMGTVTVLWKRPLIEFERREPPYEVNVFTAMLSSKAELRDLEATVKRLKNSD